MDIDPQALIATRENAARNGVGARLTVTDEPTLAEASADVLVANILAGPLVELAPSLAAAVGRAAKSRFPACWRTGRCRDSRLPAVV